MALYKYYVNDNDQPSGEHEVHAEWCKYVPQIYSKTYLGVFADSHAAVRQARTVYVNVDGCANCCPLSHTK